MKKRIRSFFKFIYSLISLLFLSFQLKKKNSVLFISHDMSISGAPLVLKKMIEKTKLKYGIYPIILTLKPGELCFQFIKEGTFPISCEYFENFIKKQIVKTKFKNIFLNTVVCCEWAKYFENNKINYTWWIHESNYFAKQYIDKLPYIKYGEILFVSEYSRNSFKKLGFSPKSDIFSYYLEKNLHSFISDKKMNKKKQIIVVGSISPWKNQIEAITAFNLIQKNCESNIKLTLIGKVIDSSYFEEVKKLVGSNPKIEFINYIPNNEMWRVYKEASLLICCSIDDSLPVTITEAYMYGCKAIVSSCCGHYDLISNKYNGIKYTCGNIKELVECIFYGLSEESDKILFGQYKLYEDNFSEKAFDDRLDTFFNK